LIAGTRVGVLFAAVAIVGHVFEDFGGLRPPAPAILGVSSWGLMFLCLGVASSVTYAKFNSLGLGVVASVWSALVSTVATVVFALSIGLTFMPHMQLVLTVPFAASGMTDARAFVIRNMSESAAVHLLAAPAVAVVVGGVGGLASATFRAFSRRVQMALGALGLLLFVAAVASIRFASSLDRPARPPFIMFGLVSLGVVLASAYPLMAAIRQPKDAAACPSR
jgi:hypothetical protein